MRWKRRGRLSSRFWVTSFRSSRISLELGDPLRQITWRLPAVDGTIRRATQPKAKHAPANSCRTFFCRLDGRFSLQDHAAVFAACDFPQANAKTPNASNRAVSHRSEERRV